MKLIDKDALVAEIDKRIIDAPINNIGHQRVWAYNDVKDILNTLVVKELQEEPVSEDLEDEIAKFNNNYFPETDNSLNIVIRKELRTIVGNAIKKGAQWKEQQMMKDAKQSDVVITSGGILLSDLKIEDFDYADKVKVIIIKQE